MGVCTFIKADTTDGQWLSPVATERVWQEKQLVNIFGHYPNASPRWQYMNGLIQNSLQTERMYTYDEMRTIAYQAYCLGQLDEPTEGKYNLWIQQFKKK